MNKLWNVIKPFIISAIAVGQIGIVLAVFLVSIYLLFSPNAWEHTGWQVLLLVIFGMYVFAGVGGTVILVIEKVIMIIKYYKNQR